MTKRASAVLDENERSWSVRVHALTSQINERHDASRRMHNLRPRLRFGHRLRGGRHGLMNGLALSVEAHEVLRDGGRAACAELVRVDEHLAASQTAAVVQGS